MKFAFFSCVLAALMAIPAHAQWWSIDGLGPQMRQATPATEKITYTRAHFDSAYTAIATAYGNKDFAKLEKMHDEFVQQRLRADDGRWMLEAFQQAFDATFYVVGPEPHKATFAEWKARMPNSKFRSVAEAHMWQRQAWSARGGQFAAQVPGEAMEVFGQWLGNAQKSLNEAGEGGKASPLWHWVALIVAGSTGRPGAEQDALLKEAQKRFPGYQPHYYTRVNYLLPQWGGSWREVDKFIKSASVATAAENGSAFYAWLYLDVSRKTRGDVMIETEIAWPALKKSFEDMVARFPNDWNKNLFATFACRARDRETTARLMSELGAKAKLGAYSSGYNNETCARIAQMKA